MNGTSWIQGYAVTVPGPIWEGRDRSLMRSKKTVHSVWLTIKKDKSIAKYNVNRTPQK